MVLTAMLMLRQRAIARAFVAAGATAATQARTAADVGLRPGMAWQQLAAYGVLRSPASGVWFLDRERWCHVCRRRYATAGIVVAGIAFAWVFAWSMHWH